MHWALSLFCMCLCMTVCVYAYACNTCGCILVQMCLPVEEARDRPWVFSRHCEFFFCVRQELPLVWNLPSSLDPGMVWRPAQCWFLPSILFEAGFLMFTAVYAKMISDRELTVTRPLALSSMLDWLTPRSDLSLLWIQISPFHLLESIVLFSEFCNKLWSPLK